MVSLLRSYSSKNRESGPVCLYVIWNPNILHQAVSNLEAISEPDQLTNARAGGCVWKCKNIWPTNYAWNSHHVFICDPTAKCWAVGPLCWAPSNHPQSLIYFPGASNSQISRGWDVNILVIPKNRTTKLSCSYFLVFWKALSYELYQACMQTYFAKTGSFMGQNVEFRLLCTTTIK